MRTYETRNDLTKLQLAKLEREDPAAYLEYAAKKRKAAKDKEKRDRNDPKCNTGNYQCRGKKGVACIPKSKGCSTDLKNINPARRQYIETIVNGLKAEGAKPKTARIGRKLGAPIVELTPEQYGKALGTNISQLKLMRGDATREQLRAIGVDVDGVEVKPKTKLEQAVAEKDPIGAIAETEERQRLADARDARLQAEAKADAKKQKLKEPQNPIFDVEDQRENAKYLRDPQSDTFEKDYAASVIESIADARDRGKSRFLDRVISPRDVQALDDSLKWGRYYPEIPSWALKARSTMGLGNIGDSADKYATKTTNAWNRAYEKADQGDGVIRLDNKVSKSVRDAFFNSLNGISSDRLGRAIERAEIDRYKTLQALGIKSEAEFDEALKEYAAIKKGGKIEPPPSYTPQQLSKAESQRRYQGISVAISKAIKTLEDIDASKKAKPLTREEKEALFLGQSAPPTTSAPLSGEQKQRIREGMQAVEDIKALAPGFTDKGIDPRPLRDLAKQIYRIADDLDVLRGVPTFEAILNSPGALASWGGLSDRGKKALQYELDKIGAMAVMHSDPRSFGWLTPRPNGQLFE